MPTYQYACTNPECGNRFEEVQAFTDSAIEICPVCGQRVRKVYGSVGVVFKGSGFYRNDSREGDKKATAAAGSSTSTDTGSSSSSGSSDAGSSTSSSDSGSGKSSGSSDSGSSSSSSGSSGSGGSKDSGGSSSGSKSSTPAPASPAKS